MSDLWSDDNQWSPTIGDRISKYTDRFICWFIEALPFIVATIGVIGGLVWCIMGPSLER